jgi:autotransporter-associated beta strand protein
LIVGQAGASTFAGTLHDGNGPLALSMSGAGLLNLSGMNVHSGGTFMEGTGTLQLGSSAALGRGGLTADMGTVDLNGFSPVVSTLSGLGGTITSSVSGAGLTVTDGGGFWGTIQDGLGQDGADLPVSLTLSGGDLSLGGVNTYGGGTVVSGGTLTLANPAAVADGSSLTVGEASAFNDVPGATVAAVPEPGTAALLAAGAIGLLGCAGRKRRSKREARD